MYDCPVYRLCMLGDFSWLAGGIWRYWAFHDVDGLSGQLRLKLVQSRLSQGTLCRGCTCGAIGAKAVCAGKFLGSLCSRCSDRIGNTKSGVNMGTLGLYIQRIPKEDSQN